MFRRLPRILKAFEINLTLFFYCHPARRAVALRRLVCPVLNLSKDRRVV